MAQQSLHPPARRTRTLRARSARQRGVVIVIAVFSTFLIAGMIGYVFNTGRHAQLRTETQNAADATAISGAGFIARSFNTVAMNNVEISRLIVIVQMLDSIPLAIEHTLLDLKATRDVIEYQIRRGLSERWIRDQLLEIRAELILQISRLIEMDKFFNDSGYDVREMTFYNSKFGRGELWKAMESLDAISLATMENLGGLAQVNASEFGTYNMHHDGVNHEGRYASRHGDDSPPRQNDTIAFIAPFESAFAWERHTFEDFHRPVVEGRLPQTGG